MVQAGYRSPFSLRHMFLCAKQLGAIVQYCANTNEVVHAVHGYENKETQEREQRATFACVSSAVCSMIGRACAALPSVDRDMAVTDSCLLAERSNQQTTKDNRARAGT